MGGESSLNLDNTYILIFRGSFIFGVSLRSVKNRSSRIIRGRVGLSFGGGGVGLRPRPRRSRSSDGHI